VSGFWDETLTELAEGAYHRGPAAVVRLVLRRARLQGIIR
jgi:hypothetical protein